MTRDQSEFEALMRRLRQGSPDAAQEVVSVYARHILRVVRRRMSQQMRSLFDSRDLMQDVWASFFADPPEARVFDHPEALVAYLVRMARNKVIDTFRQHALSRKREANRCSSLDGSAAHDAEDLRAALPTPSQVAVAREELEQFLQDQPSHHQRIVLLRAEGQTHAAIAQGLGVSEKMVQRVLKKLSSRRLP